MPYLIAGTVVFVLGGIVGAKLAADLEETAKSAAGCLVIGAAAGAGAYLVMKRVSG